MLILPKSEALLTAFLTVALSCAAGAHDAFAQGHLAGVVKDDLSGVPVSIAEIELRSLAGELVGSTLSNEGGEFEFQVMSSGTFALFVHHLGYLDVRADSIQIADGADVELQVRLGVAAVPLAPITVVVQRDAEPARITQFKERALQSQRTGRGKVYLREDIDRVGPRNTQQLLQGVIWAPRCRPVILFDGLPVEGSLSSVLISEVEGMEIYRSPTEIPSEFYRPGMCGLALVWSRVGGPGLKPMTWRRAAVAGVVLLLIGISAR